MARTTQIRLMQLEDLPSVAKIAAESSVHPWTEEVFQDCLQSHSDYFCWVLHQKNVKKPLGFIVILLQLDECQLLNVCVRKTEQRKGYGQLLLQHIIAFAEKKQCKKIVLEVRHSNASAISLYRKLDFKEVGLRKNYYPKDQAREDAVLMELEIF
jgi:[ribosomal protein S18]-alanine N-acetyltransferase